MAPDASPVHPTAELPSLPNFSICVAPNIHLQVARAWTRRHSGIIFHSLAYNNTVLVKSRPSEPNVAPVVGTLVSLLSFLRHLFTVKHFRIQYLVKHIIFFSFGHLHYTLQDFALVKCARLPRGLYLTEYSLPSE